MASVGMFELVMHVIDTGMLLVKLSYIEPFLPLCNMYEQIYIMYVGLCPVTRGFLFFLSFH